MKNTEQYNLLANLFRYPMAEYKSHVNECNDYVQTHFPEASKEMETFTSFVNGKTAFEIEEVFGQTFHIQAICFLDLGYVLFGEDYKRGDFLVQMKNEQAKANNDCGSELADNLPNVLSLIPLLKDEEFRTELGARIIIPAIEKMIGEFDSARMELKTKVRKKKEKVILLENLEGGNIYQHAIKALLAVLKEDFKGTEYQDPTIIPGLRGDVLSCGSSCSTPEEADMKTAVTK